MKTYTIEQAADRLGEIRAQMKTLQDEAKAIEGLLKAAAQAEDKTAITGDYFHVSFSFGVETKRVDWKAVAAKLEPSYQLVTAHTKTSVSDRVRVTAHIKTR